MRAQVDLGPRVPGSAAHRDLADALCEAMGRYADRLIVQEFPLDFLGRRVVCRNLIGEFRLEDGGSAERPPLLLATHFDTRAVADREPDETRRGKPIPGANDGGSGTAVLLSLLETLGARTAGRDVVVAFVDAEDVGHIEGHEFSTGAEYLAGHPPEGFAPWGEVVALDMIGGRDMVLDIDAHSMSHKASRGLTAEVFRLGHDLGYPPFLRDKRGRCKYIVSDHFPFLRRGVPSCLLIDIDYPQWHTQADLPEAMSEESLSVSRGVLSAFLARRRG